METPRKHIDIVVKYFFPVTAGIETNIHETYGVLAKQGWDITIHTSKDTALEKDVLPDNEVINGLTIKRYPFRRFGFSPAIEWDKTDLVCLHNFDIFPHFQIMVRTLYYRLLGIQHYKLMITPHGGYNPEWSVFPIVSRIIKWVYTFTLGTFLANRSATGIRAVSEWERYEMKKWGLKPELLTTISNGIEKEAYMDIDQEASEDIKSKVRMFGTYLIQIGRIYPIKNYEVTLRALALLPQHIHYVIAGPISDLKYKGKLDGMIRELGLTRRVHFVGVIRGVDKYYLIKHAAMMVHMALWESFCNVVHEGLSQGLVCVVANNTALPFLVKDGVNGYCIETHDHIALARKIYYVLRNEKSPEIREMKKRNKIFGREHSWTYTADQMDRWYSDVLEKSPETGKKTAARRLLSVTVGVPAHNEGKNITQLLHSVLAQEQNGFTLKQVIVTCDNCSDDTASRARSISSKLIKVVEDKNRLGKTGRMNQIFGLAKTEVVVILDADIEIPSNTVLAELVAPMKLDKAVMLSCGRAVPLKGSTVVQKAISAGFETWDHIRHSVKGSGLYLTDGPIRAFRKKLYTEMRFPLKACEDVYPYLYCMDKEYMVIHAPAAEISYRTATTYSEFRRQITRSLQSEYIQSDNFNKDFVAQYYVIGIRDKVRGLAWGLMRHPFWMSLYVVMLAIPKLMAPFARAYRSPIWSIATSTKKTHHA